MGVRRGQQGSEGEARVAQERASCTRPSLATSAQPYSSLSDHAKSEQMLSPCIYSARARFDGRLEHEGEAVEVTPFPTAEIETGNANLMSMKSIGVRSRYIRSCARREHSRGRLG